MQILQISTFLDHNFQDWAELKVVYMWKRNQEVPSFQQAQTYLPTPALPEQLFLISMDMFIFKNLSFIRSTEGEGGNLGVSDTSGNRYLIPIFYPNFFNVICIFAK